jgi:nucleotide-binding universal stress UspA family protein
MTRRAAPQRILVPTDLEPPADEALECALALAERTGAEVHALHVFDTPLSDVPGTPWILSDEMIASCEKSARFALERNVAKHARPGVEVQLLVRRGDAKSEIQRAITDVGADLVCMGTHGRRGVSRVFMGSVAEGVLRSSDVPVLTVRTSAEA